MSRLVTLPSGLTVRGRALAEPPSTAADFLLALALLPLGRGPAASAWPCRRIRWPDFWVPLDRTDALDGLDEVLRRARRGERVEVGCRGGRGRTGTALAALAVLDGMPADRAVRWVREDYHPRAVETSVQRRWLRSLAVPL